MRSPVGESVEVGLDLIAADERYLTIAKHADALWYSSRDRAGQFVCIGWRQKRAAFFGLDFNRRELVFSSDDLSVLELDPDAGEILLVLARRGLSSWSVTRPVWDQDRGWHTEAWGWVGQLSAACKTHHEVSRACEWERYAEPRVARFRYRSLRHYSDLRFYHATRKSLISSAKGIGLLPSKLARDQFPDENMTFMGWTSLNFDLQDAIYLTANPDYALSIAATLADRWEEPAVVVEIQGRDLNPLNLTLDEDAIRDRYHGHPSDDGCRHVVPAYFSSLLWGSHLSVAYLDWIPTSKLRFVHEEHPE